MSGCASADKNCSGHDDLVTLSLQEGRVMFLPIETTTVPTATEVGVAGSTAWQDELSAPVTFASEGRVRQLTASRTA
jgi:hypothetical protein